MRRFLAVFLAISIFFSLGSTVWADGSVTLSISAEKTTVRPGDEVTFTISVNNTTGTTIGTVGFNLDIPQGFTYVSSNIVSLSKFKGQTGYNSDEGNAAFTSSGGTITDTKWDVMTLTLRAEESLTVGEHTVGFKDDSDLIVGDEMGVDLPGLTTASAAITVPKASSSLAISGNMNKTYDGRAVDDPSVTTNGDQSKVTFLYYTDERCTIQTDTTNSGAAGAGQAPKNAGTYWVEATLPESGSAQSAKASKSFTISPADYTFDYTHPNTTVTVGDSHPTPNSNVKGSGAGEDVTGTLTWYTNSGRTVLANGNFDSAGSTTLYWRFVASHKNFVTTPKEGSTVFTVQTQPLHKFTEGFDAAATAKYEDKAFSRAATLADGSGAAISYSSSNEKIATVDASGNVTLKGAGTATITAVAEASAGYARTTISYTLTITPKTLVADDLEYKSGNKSKTYDGTTTAQEITVGVKSGSLVNSSDTVTVRGTAVYNDKNVASADKIIFTAEAIVDGNYRLSAGARLEITKDVSIATRPITVTVVPATRKYGEINPAFTATLANGYTLGQSDNISSLNLTLVSTADENSAVGSYDVTGSGSNANYTVQVKGVKALTVTKANPTYSVPATQQIKVGSSLEKFMEIAQNKGAGIGGAEVTGTVTWYSNTNRTVEAKESDIHSLAVNASKTLYWKFVPDNKNYADMIGQTSFKIVEGDPQKITFAETEVSVAYGDGSVIKVPVHTNDKDQTIADGGAITYGSSDSSIAAVNRTTGEVTIKKVGNVIITAKAAAVPGKYAEGTGSYILTITPRPVTVVVDAATRPFGKANPIFSAQLKSGSTMATGETVDDLGLGLYSDANEVSDVGEYEIKGDGVYNGNYAVTIENGNKLTVTQADLIIPEQSVALKYVTSGMSGEISLAGLLPANAGGNVSYVKGTEDTGSSGITVNAFALDATSGKLTYELSGGAVDKSVTLSAIIRSKNYADSIVNVVITLTDKNVPKAVANAITTTYNGATVEKSIIAGTATFDGKEVLGSWDWKGGTNVKNVVDSGPKTVVFTPADTGSFTPVEYTIQVIINKADITGEPSYKTVITGQTLKEAGLGIGTLTPANGTLRWDLPDDTPVVPNTPYTWIYTPADRENYNEKTGTIILNKKNSGSQIGSGSESGDRDDDEENESLYRPGEQSFWNDVSDLIKNAKNGDVVRVHARGYDRMPWSVMETLRQNSGVTLLIDWNGGKTITIPGNKALSEVNRLYYPLSYLQGVDFGDVKIDPSKLNPSMGGFWSIDAPLEADKIQTEFGKPEITDARRGTAENEDMMARGIEKTIPGVYELEKTSDRISGVVITLTMLLLGVAATGGFWYWKRRDWKNNQQRC